MVPSTANPYVRDLKAAFCMLSGCRNLCMLSIPVLHCRALVLLQIAMFWCSFSEFAVIVQVEVSHSFLQASTAPVRSNRLRVQRQTSHQIPQIRTKQPNTHFSTMAMRSAVMPWNGRVSKIAPSHALRGRKRTGMTNWQNT